MSEAAAQPEVIGYVEAATGTQVLGWAWAPRAPAERLQVQMLLDGEVLAEAAADREREDLARNGIGDGRHAFDLAVPERARPRLADIRVVARDGAGRLVPLGAPPPPEAEAERLDRLQRGIDHLVASQRLLHRNVQAALLQRPGSDDGAIGEIAKSQAELGRQIATLEVFCMRLDERLAAVASPAAMAPARLPRMMQLAVGFAGAALAISLWGLWRSLP
jgi:hypothetical protein